MGAKGHPTPDICYTPGAGLAEPVLLTRGLCLARQGNGGPKDEVTASLRSQGKGLGPDWGASRAPRRMSHYSGGESARLRCRVTTPRPLPAQHQEPGALAKAPIPGHAQMRLPSSSLLLLLPERSFPPQTHLCHTTALSSQAANCTC